MNIICIGARVTGFMAAQELIVSFLNAKFIGEERYIRRLKKIEALESIVEKRVN